MEYRHSLIVLLLVLLFAESAQTQTVEGSPHSFYERTIIKGRDATPLLNVRETDVVWEKTIWRTIDFREKFNQYFYYPIEHKGIAGRRNFAYVIWDAVVADEIPIFADDEMKIPLDNSMFVEQFTKADTIILEIVDDDENYEYKTVLVPKEFNSEEMLQIKMKEAWYIDKQTTEQYVRPLAICLTKELYKEHDGDLDYIGTAEMFWVPMQSIQVRNLLVRNEAYFEENLANQPSWENVFVTRRFNSYITRETNVFNRAIFDYLTGPDAIWESERLESKLLEISLDMWEY